MGKYDNVGYFNHINNVRQELDAKIETKVSNNTFFAILGIIITIVGSILLYNFDQLGSVRDKLHNLAGEVIVLATKFDEQNKPSPLYP